MPKSRKRKSLYKKLGFRNQKIWAVAVAVVFVGAVGSLFFILNRTQQSTAPTEAEAAYNLAPYLDNVEFSASRISIKNGDEDYALPTRGTWSFKEIYAHNGDYYYSPANIMPGKENITVIGKFKSRSGNQNLDVRMRFNKDGEGWWINGAIVNII